MGVARFRCDFYRALVASAMFAVALLAGTPPSPADDAPPSGTDLKVNPKLARAIPPPGWIADHRDAWAKEHPVYSENCRTEAVTDEIRFMNRIIDYDEYLINLTQSYLGASTGHDASAVKQLDLAKATVTSLHNDIGAADSLTTRLQALPSCGASATTANAVPAMAEPAPQPEAPAAPGAATMSAPGPTSPSTPTAAMTAAGPTAPAWAATSTAATTTVQIQPQAAVTARRQPAPAGNAPPRLVIRFDNRVAALTPSGIRAFDQAVSAARSGRQIQIAVEGCEAKADFANGSPCARRLLSLKQMLAENGVRDPKRLLADIR